MQTMDPVDHDLALALQLQEEFDRESAVKPQNPTPQQELSPVDERWETLDPNPDIRALFLQFNEQFFWGRLAGIEVKWSPRMTLCAGLCCYEGRGGLCSVRLSTPLLKLRPRKDLVETLLHEMIHAYLFVTDNNKDHDGHGPEFHKHMYRINAATGANISVYHTFHDEVAEYRQHWWRCNGPCQNRKPYFGYVKRAMNRAPSARDPWFKDHQNSCNGSFIKVKEPENYGKKKGKDKEDNKMNKGKDANNNKGNNKNMDIRIFAGKGHSLTGASTSKLNVTASSVFDDSNFSETSSSKVNELKSNSKSSVTGDSFETRNPATKKYFDKINSSDSDSDSDLKVRKSVSSGSLADADKKSDKKKTFVKFYSTDSDDEIPLEPVSSQYYDQNRSSCLSDSNKNTAHGQTSDLPTIPYATGSDSSNNKIGFDDSSALVLSDSEDELFANLEIPQFNSDIHYKVKEDTNSDLENSDKKSLEISGSSQDFPGEGHIIKKSSEDSNIDVRLKLREVWGKKNDTFSKHKHSALNNIHKFKTNAVSRNITSKDMEAKNEPNTLPIIKKPSIKHKRLSEEEELPECSKKAKLSDESYSFTKIEDIFRKMKSPKGDKNDRNSNNSGHESVMTKPDVTISVSCHDCPVCSKSIPAVEINSHLDICLGTS